MFSEIDKIMEGDWYKTATPREMRVALMHLEMGAMDSLSNHLNEKYRERRNNCFDDCMEDITITNNEGG